MPAGGKAVWVVAVSYLPRRGGQAPGRGEPVLRTGTGWGGTGRRWGGVGPCLRGAAVSPSQCPPLGVPSENLVVVWGVAGGGGKLTGFALCWWRMWPTPSQQSRLAEQQRKLAFEQKCHQAQNGTVAPSSMGAEVGAPPPRPCRGVSAFCVRSWGRGEGPFPSLSSAGSPSSEQEDEQRKMNVAASQC